MREPDWQTHDGKIKLYHGDCRELLPGMSDDCAAIFDPPYGISHEAHRTKSEHAASWSRTQIQGDGDTKIRDFILEWCAERPWACFGTWKVPTPPAARGVLIFDKGPQSGTGDLSFPWKASFEEIAVGGRGWIGRRDEGVLRGFTQVSWESKGRCHPHQKPVGLLEYIISKLPEEMLIVDPTMGSGTCGLACARSRRRFVGVEVERKYFDISVQRVSEELERLPLFEKIVKHGECQTQRELL